MIRFFAALLTLAAMGEVSAAAMAQTIFTATIQSDLRFRGRSLSDGLPVATLGVETRLDDVAYFGVSAAGTVSRSGEAGLLVGQSYVGYAQRIAPQTSIDLGIIATHYTSLYSGRRADTQVEVYGGVIRGAASAYIRYSPSYFGSGTPVVYGQLAVTKQIAPRWRLNGSAGLVIQTAGTTGLGGRRSRYDIGLGISRDLGRATVSLNWTLGGPDDSYYSGPWRGRSAIAVGLSAAF